MILTFPQKLPSWNQFFGRSHWTNRQRMNYQWTLLVLEALDFHHSVDPFKVRVDLIVTVYSTHPMDCDNICVKPLVDALIGHVLVDDKPKYVRSVKLVSEKAKTKKSERTIVEVKPCS